MRDIHCLSDRLRMILGQRKLKIRWWTGRKTNGRPTGKSLPAFYCVFSLCVQTIACLFCVNWIEADFSTFGWYIVSNLMECTVLPPIITCMFLAMLKSQLSGWNCWCMYVARLLWAFDAEISPFLEHDDFFLKYSVLLETTDLASQSATMDTAYEFENPHL